MKEKIIHEFYHIVGLCGELHISLTTILISSTLIYVTYKVARYYKSNFILGQK